MMKWTLLKTNTRLFNVREVGQGAEGHTLSYNVAVLDSIYEAIFGGIPIPKKKGKYLRNT